jgi:hypothetical protein
MKDLITYALFESTQPRQEMIEDEHNAGDLANDEYLCERVCDAEFDVAMLQSITCLVERMSETACIDFVTNLNMKGMPERAKKYYDLNPK